MIFSMQYDTRGLKGVLEFILENLGLQKEAQAKDNVVLMKAVGITNVHTEQIALLQKICKELEEKSVYMENSISDVKSTTESNTLNISLNHKQMEQNNNDLNEKITALQALVDELIKRKPVV